jgi:hypothetical protein
LASAMEVSSRLWLGGALSRHRDIQLIRALLLRVCACGLLESILLVTDGLSSYKSQALKVFRKPLHTGKAGRPKLVLPAGVMIARVIKRYQRRRVAEVIRRVVVGSEAEVISRVIGTQRSIRALINTAYIERLNATFRARLAPLARRTRAGAYKQCTLEPTFRTPFYVFESFLLDTHMMDNLPAKQGYRSHQIRDFARMGSSKGTGIIHQYGAPFRRSASQSTPGSPRYSPKLQ